MKKQLFQLFLLSIATIMLFAGCSNDKDTYAVKQIVIDANSSAILLDINHKI